MMGKLHTKGRIPDADDGAGNGITITVANGVYTINIANATSKVYVNGDDIPIGQSSSKVRINGDVYMNGDLTFRNQSSYSNAIDFREYWLQNIGEE